MTHDEKSCSPEQTDRLGRKIYTYVVEHKNDEDLKFVPRMDVNGGELQTVAFYDALYILKMCEDALQAVLELDLPEDIKEMVNRALLYS